MVLDDVAKVLGVSKATVSRAISGRGRMAKETRERILAYVAEAGYTPNASARNLATTRTRNLAYCMPLREAAIMSTYFLECLFGVSQAASDAGYNVIVVDDRMDEMLRIAGSRKVDGLVLSLFNHGDDAMRKLLGYGLPLVLTGSSNVHGVIQVSYDARPAFRDLTNHLMDTWQMPLGLILTEKTFPANQSRADGFRDAMTPRGIMNPPICWDAYDKDRMVEALFSLYRQGIRGIICGDDSICMDLLSALMLFSVSQDDEKRSLAAEVHIASFHSNRSLRIFHPEVPTVEMDPMKLGQFAAKMAIHEIEEGDTPMSTMLHHHLHKP